ncbi:MAG: response regulator [Sphingobium sp.]
MIHRTSPLQDVNILLVEDEYLIAADIEMALTRQGATIVGLAPTVADALIVIDQADRLDCAVLDINLGTETSYPVADALTIRNVPVIFVTGYDSLMLPAAFASFPRLNKPFNTNILVSTITAIVER